MGLGWLGDLFALKWRCFKILEKRGISDHIMAPVSSFLMFENFRPGTGVGGQVSWIFNDFLTSRPGSGLTIRAIEG